MTEALLAAAPFAAWAAACFAVAAWCWYKARHQHRDDWYDRRLQGAGWSWWIFDRDARQVAKLRAAAVALVPIGVLPAAAVHPAATATVAVFAVSAWALAKHRRGEFRWTRAIGRYEPVMHHDGREQIVYALGGWHPTRGTLDDIKFGVTIRGDEVRAAEVDAREQTARVEILATGPGGEDRENELLAAGDQWRYPRSEWFEANTAVLALVATLEQPTPLGRRVLSKTNRRRRKATL